MALSVLAAATTTTAAQVAQLKRTRGTTPCEKSEKLSDAAIPASPSQTGSPVGPGVLVLFYKRSVININDRNELTCIVAL